MSETKQVQKRFHNVGVAQIAPSGRSLRLDITNDPSTVFDKILYISKQHLKQILQGQRKTATVYVFLYE